MNVNTESFTAYICRRKQANVFHNKLINISKQRNPTFLKSERTCIENFNKTESFLPSIPMANASNDGHRPYRRNDFANNNLFVAKNKLARVFLDRPATQIESNYDLIHLFDRYEPKQKSQVKNKIKSQEIKMKHKYITKFNRDSGHLAVVNLGVKPFLSATQMYDTPQPMANHQNEVVHSQPRASRSSMGWINPIIAEHIQATSNLLIRRDLNPNFIINELQNKNLNNINCKYNTLDASILHIKSIINATHSKEI